MFNSDSKIFVIWICLGNTIFSSNEDKAQDETSEMDTSEKPKKKKKKKDKDKDKNVEWVLLFMFNFMFNIRTENICYINVQKANSCALKSPPPPHLIRSL